MPPNSPQKSALCRAPPSQETTIASAASARAPEKILAFHDTFRRNFIERAKLWSCIPCTAACPSQKEKPHDSHERRYSPAREPEKMLASRDFSRFVCIEQREETCASKHERSSPPMRITFFRSFCGPCARQQKSGLFARAPPSKESFFVSAASARAEENLRYCALANAFSKQNWPLAHTLT